MIQVSLQIVAAFREEGRLSLQLTVAAGRQLPRPSWWKHRCRRQNDPAMSSRLALQSEKEHRQLASVRRCSKGGVLLLFRCQAVRGRQTRATPGRPHRLVGLGKHFGVAALRGACSEKIQHTHLGSALLGILSLRSCSYRRHDPNVPKPIMKSQTFDCRNRELQPGAPGFKGHHWHGNCP